MRHLLVASPDLNETISWWRAWGPLVRLRNERGDLELKGFDMMRAPGIEWSVAHACDALFFQRPFSSNHMKAIHFLRSLGKPLWTDFDDCIWQLPRYNTSWDVYNADAQEQSRIAAAISNVVTASTDRLAEYMKNHVAPDAEIRVIPNTLPDDYQWAQQDHEKIVIYRGMRGHLGDLDTVAEELDAVAETHPDWEFVFVGCDPFMLEMKNKRVVKPMPLPEFHRFLRECKASIFINPLRDNEFNRCKSNISWLEASVAGAAFIGPDFEEFRRPGAMTYAPGTFGETLSELIELPAEVRAAFVRESRTYIDAHLRHRNVNPARAAIIEELLP